MKWHIEGADARTGRNSALTLDAPDERTAAIMARERGLLVSGVKQDTAKPLNYAPKPPPAPIPYAALRRSCRIAEAFANILGIIGTLIAVAGLIAIILLSRSGQLWDAIPGAIALAAGLLLVLSAVILRVFTGIAWAVRDMAIAATSGRQPPSP